METLSASESFLEAALAACALAVALWSVRASLGSTSQSPRTGEVVWSLVAVTVLVGVLVAARLGAGHGI